MIYFDNAATSWPKPPEAITAVVKAVQSFGNPTRGAHPFALTASRAVEEARLLAAELFGCSGPDRVAFTKNATEALNLAINSIDGHIVTSENEHNSVLRPLYRRGNLSIVPIDELGRYRAADIIAECRADTRAAILSHASNVTGNVMPLEEIGAFCRERDILFIVDAAQTAGYLDIDMRAMHTDALCFTGHKSLYGLQGSGGICLSRRFSPRPLIVGGSGSDTFNEKQPPEYPGILEAGTANSPGIATLAAGIEYIMRKKTHAIRETTDALARRFIAACREIPGVSLLGDIDAPLRIPVVSLNVGNLDSGDVAAELADEYGIAVRAGAHCAPLLHKRLGTESQGAVRFSFSHFNTAEEIDYAAKALRCIK